MGIFGNKQQDNQTPQDDPMQVPIPPAAITQGSIDGVISTYQDPEPRQAIATSAGAPPVAVSQSATPVGDYIMSDAPVQQSASWDEPTHQHDIDTGPLVSTPVAPTSPGPVVEQSDIDPFEAARAVPSTHPLPSHATSTPDDLASIKEDALRELSPLVSHLDQSPEERFHTAMMMLQATDDHTLVKAAYEAAKAITDEKARAQALLDIVNEINYFTQQKS